jgi:4-hydroxybenzoate polyprenyltransferase/phosphoserine phosphatase
MESTPSPPFCVDLDGTLLHSDLLVESALSLLAKQPWMVFAFPIWLLRGKATLKREIAERADIDASTLPYDPRVLDALRQAGEAGRTRVLCSASDQRLVDAVAKHLGLFEVVIGSDGERNLAGSRKAAALSQRFGERGFDYAGNANVDLPVWRVARRAWVVNASESLARRAAAECDVETHLPSESGGLRTWIKALRIHQWLKNLLVFLPLAASHRFFEAGAIIDSLAAFLAFGLCASGVYLLNDLLDLPVDRQHPRKRLRPFAAGKLDLLTGALAAPLLTLAGLGLALATSPAFALILGGYYMLTLGYSLRLKRVPMLDVILLAALYTVRIVGGAVAIGSTLSFWLLAFSMFIFLSLALLKRYAELHSMLVEGKAKAAGRGYAVEDLPLLQSLGAASGYLAVLVLALYINSPESLALYDHPMLLWLVCPMMLYWISRAWIVAHRGGMDDDPVVFAVTDRVSQVVVAICLLAVLAAI